MNEYRVNVFKQNRFMGNTTRLVPSMIVIFEADKEA